MANSEQRRANIALGNSLLDRSRGPPAWGHDRSAVQEPRPAHGGRADTPRRSRGPQPHSRDSRPCHRRDGAHRPSHHVETSPCRRTRSLLATSNSSVMPTSISRTRETVVCRLADGRRALAAPSAQGHVAGTARRISARTASYLRVRHAVQEELGVTEIWDLGAPGACLSRGNPVRHLPVPPQRPTFLLRAGRGRAWRSGTSSFAAFCRRLPLDSPEPSTLLLDAARTPPGLQRLRQRDVRLLDVDTGRELGRLYRLRRPKLDGLERATAACSRRATGTDLSSSGT